VSLIAIQPPVLAVSRSAGFITLTWVAVSGRTNWLEYKDDLHGATWTVLSNITGSGSPTSIADGPISANAQRFYRVRVQ
jgi:hypothetical protein